MLPAGVTDKAGIAATKTVARDLVPAHTRGESFPASASASLEEVERRHIRAVLSQTGGVVEGPKGAARILDLHPNTLRSRMKKLGITVSAPIK
jgi:transcriptional regulator with GAF, ATPase, and Fis domain